MNKRYAIIGVGITLIGLLVSFSFNNTHFYNVVAGATECSSHSGYHYEKKEPTIAKTGCKEFWTCCKCQRQFLEKPSGSFVDRDVDLVISSIDENHIAYLKFDDNQLAKLSLVSDNISFLDDNASYEYSNFKFNGTYAYESTDSLFKLEHLGSFANTSELPEIKSINLNVSGDISNLYLYYGDVVLPYKTFATFDSEEKEIELYGKRFFNLSYQGDEEVVINVLDINYNSNGELIGDNEITKVYINTELDGNDVPLPIYSKEVYTNAKISIDYNGEFTPLDNVKAEVKLRGVSTSEKPKKPYRIKFDKKQSIFGLTKAKNWVLLAEYFDGSSLHNYMTQKMISYIDGFKFAFNMHHVELYLNGEYNGLYIMCEHPDEKAGRLDIEQDLTLETELEDINFMLELDFRIERDKSLIEDVNYFKVQKGEKYYLYEIKYPEIDAFPDYDKETNESLMFSNFVSHLKQLYSNAWDAVLNSDETKIKEYFDFPSYSAFGMVDLIANEWDHGQTSFKMYRENGSKIKFGPCWDYDTVAYGFTASDGPYTDPFKDTHKVYDHIYQPWLYPLIDGGFKNDFYSMVKEFCSTFEAKILSDFEAEYELIDMYLLKDRDMWDKSNISTIFENVRYFYQYIDNRLTHFATL